MDTTNMVLKTKLSEVLETLNLIILLYTIFLSILGIIIHNTEVIIQTCIMGVVYIIFEYINYDFLNISNKGIKCEKFGFIEWNDIYRITKKDNLINVYTKNREKPYKIIINKKEDKQEVSRIYKYMISKVKTPERIRTNKNKVET